MAGPDGDITLPESLVAAARDRRLMLFVGSGASQPAGAPSWRELLQEMIDECGREAIELSDEDELNDIVANGSTDDLLMAADYLKDTMKVAFAELIERRFSPAQLPVQAVHESIASLAPVGVITTNYDSLIEDALPDGYKTIVPGDQFNEARAAEDFVLKLHGTREAPNDVVIGTADYHAIFDDKATQATVARLFQQYTVLFVGFGMADPDTLTLLVRLRKAFGGQGKRHYALLERGRIGRVRREYLRDHLQVQTIPYTASTKDHPEVAEYLKELGTLAGRSRAMVKTLLAIKGRAVFNSGSGEPRLLVSSSNKQWSHDGEPAYMLPSVQAKPDDDDFAEKVADYLGVQPDGLTLEPSQGEHRNTKPNPAMLGERVEYRFHFVEPRFGSDREDLADQLSRLGGKDFEWRTLTELRNHTATMELNSDVMVEVSRRYGGALENLDVAVDLNERDDPYDARAQRYGGLPWVGADEIFDHILRDEALDGALGVLDLGCGPAILAEQLRKRHDSLPYRGFDASPAMLDQAEKCVAEIPGAAVAALDIAVERPAADYAGWVAVFKNVLHLLTRPHKAIGTLEERFGRPHRIVVVETESPSLASLSWVQLFFDSIGQGDYKRNWYSDGQVREVLELYDIEIVSDELVEQELDIDAWLASFGRSEDKLRDVEGALERASDQVVEEMQIVNEPGARRMLRRQRVLHAKLPD